MSLLRRLLLRHLLLLLCVDRSPKRFDARRRLLILRIQFTCALIGIEGVDLLFARLIERSKITPITNRQDKIVLHGKIGVYQTWLRFGLSRTARLYASSASLYCLIWK